MKLLLTSGGITNLTLASALEKLLSKPKAEAVIAFIPTAANAQDGDKSWLEKDLENLRALGYNDVDIVDIDALTPEEWEPRLKRADVLFFGGGHTQYLMRRIEESGLRAMLPTLLETRIYAGISAGSMVACLKIPSREDVGPMYDIDGLGFVHIIFEPHLNSEHFPGNSPENLKRIARDLPYPLYGLDDAMALRVTDSQIEILGDGTYVAFNVE